MLKMWHGAETSQMLRSEENQIDTHPGGGYVNVSVFGKHLEEIAESEEVTEHHLLAAKLFSFTCANNIVNYVYQNDASKKNKDD